MIGDRWQRIDQLYHEAREVPIAERETFLRRACRGDVALRQEIESLLDLQPAADRFLEQPAIESAVKTLADVLPAMGPPEIPGYRIVHELGEGGMGLVYLAEQESPLQRFVALKLIRPGMDSRQVVARFDAERQALALMDHPNIAAVYDAGSTADGRPYFVMEFVDGPPIIEYCDRERLSTRARLELFTEVCAAVQHAHQKGVIHRDLKPTNVLVAGQDGRVVPKVIDFGTAKATERSWDGAATLTAQGTVLGTIEYMSPEQAAFSRDIDTTTDVYSLGVMLYELLVGVLPFERPRPGPEGYDELRRLIRETDPLKPSTRLSSISPASSEIAAARHTNPDRLSRSLKGDLDWITLKALEKDRTRRYATVAALATDIRRFLSDEPVEARPPSAAYRIRKFTHRHRGAVAAAAALLFVLLSGLIASTAMYLRSERASAEANRQRTAAESLSTLAGTARAAAERATAEANALRQAAIDANEATKRQTQRAVAALSESEFRNYVITITAADAEIRGNRSTVARERLLTVPVARRGWEWNHLLLRTDPSLFTLADLSPCGTERQFSLGRLIATEDRTQIFLSHCQRLHRWDTLTAERAVATMPLKTSLVAASPSGRRLVTSQVGRRWELGLIDRFESEAMHVFGAVEREPICGDVSSDRTLVAIGLGPPMTATGAPMDDVFEVWNAPSGLLVHRLRPPGPATRDSRNSLERTCMVRFSPDGSLVATSGAIVRIWDTGSGGERFADSGQAGRIAQPVAFSPDGTRLAVGRRNGLVDILNLADSSVPVTHLDGSHFIRPLPIPLDADRISLVGSRSQEEARAVAFSPDGLFLVSGFFNRVAVWDLSANRMVKVLDGHESPISGLVVAPNGVIYSSDLQGSVRAWAVDGSVGVTQLEATSSATARVGISRSGHTIVTSDADGSLVAWRADDRRPVRLKPPNVTGQREMGNVAVPSSDGRFVVTSPWTEPGTSLALWSLDSGGQVETLPPSLVEPGCGELGRVQWASLSFDDRYLAYGHRGCVVVRELSTRRTIARLNLQAPGDSGRLDASDLQFRPDGALLVTASHYPKVMGGIETVSVMIWDWRANRVRALRRRTDLSDSSPIFGPPEWAVSADGRRVALSGFVPYAVSIWDGDLSHEISRLPVSTRTAIALSADGQRIATSHNQNDTSVRVWDTATGQLLLTLTDIDPHRGDIAFTPDGRLIAGRVSGGITIWETQKPKCGGCRGGR